MFAVVGSFLFYPFLAYYFVISQNLGLAGLGFGRITCEILTFITMNLYTYFKHKNIIASIWAPFNKQCF